MSSVCDRRAEGPGVASPRALPASGWAAEPVKSPRVRLERRMSAVNAEFKAAVLAADADAKARCMRRYRNLVSVWVRFEEGGAA